MGKAEIEMRIKTVEQMLKMYVWLSESSPANKKRYEATIEKFRIELASLYAQREKK